MEVNYKSNVKVLYFRERIFEVGRIRAPKHDFTNVIMEVFFILKYIHNLKIPESQIHRPGVTFRGPVKQVSTYC